MTKKQKKLFVRILIAAVLFVALKFIPDGGTVLYVLRTGLSFLAFVTVGYDVLRKAALGLFGTNIFSENLLMAVATLGAIVLEAVGGGSDYSEAIAVMLLYQIGELFQSIAVGKSRKSITALMDIRPDTANLLKDGEVETVSPDGVPIGSLILIRPGEKIPLDGSVVSGSSTVNTSALTGESVPRTVREGDGVISGCINLTGTLTVKTEREFAESTVSKILDLVENASSRKSRSEDFTAKFAKYYTPAVVFSALALALLPPAVSALLGGEAAFGVWIYRALTFLVISCPCALVISVPLTFFAGLGGAGREGILIKGSNYLETLSRVKTAVFDKTGTLTEGVFEVAEILPDGISEEELLFCAAHAEVDSSHPIAASIARAYGKPTDRALVREVKELAGHGVIAEIDGKTVAVGNAKLMKTLGLSPAVPAKVGTVAHVAIDGVYRGCLVISDKVKPTAKAALSDLHALGVGKTVILTGDAKQAAEAVAAQVGADEVKSELLPDGKVEAVETLLSEMKKGEKLAFVGDGINDAPVLSRADVGVAMGALGSDAAIEAADVVLMDDDPRKMARAVKISRKCLAIVYENIVFAIVVKLACLLLGALGYADMWAAIFADVGVMVLAVLNAIRALRVKEENRIVKS